MRRAVLLYGVLCGLLIAALELIQYQFLVVEHSLEIYGGLVAVIFAALGLWLGRRLTRAQHTVVVKEVTREVTVEVRVPATEPFVVDPVALDRLGITKREHEILELIAAGLSNREIADRLFVSENTVKTHSSRLFVKLDARRRTQVVQRAKDAGLLR